MCSLSAAFGQVADRPSTPPTLGLRRRESTWNRHKVVVRLEQHVPQLMKDGGVPGLAIVLLRGGEVVWHCGFGVRNSKTKEPVDDATDFSSGITEEAVCDAVMKLNMQRIHIQQAQTRSTYPQRHAQRRQRRHLTILLRHAR